MGVFEGLGRFFGDVWGGSLGVCGGAGSYKRGKGLFWGLGGVLSGDGELFGGGWRGLLGVYGEVFGDYRRVWRN